MKAVQNADAIKPMTVIVVEMKRPRRTPTVFSKKLAIGPLQQAVFSDERCM